MNRKSKHMAKNSGNVQDIDSKYTHKSLSNHEHIHRCYFHVNMKSNPII